MNNLKLMSIDFNDEEFDFNWAKCSTFMESNTDGGSICSTDFSLRIPKDLNYISDIEKYIDNNIPILLKEFLES